MMNLKILTILLILTPSIAFSQLKPTKQTYKVRSLIEKKKEQEKRVLQMIAVNATLFITMEYAINNGNKDLMNGCGAAFIAVNTVGATYVLSINTHTDNRRFRNRKIR